LYQGLLGKQFILGTVVVCHCMRASCGSSKHQTVWYQMTAQVTQSWIQEFPFGA